MTTRGRLLLLRHGQTDWSAARKHTGLTDRPLNADGEAQARALAPVLAGVEVDQAWSSPLSRARETARLAGLDVVRTEPLLQEWDYGAYDGRTTQEISEELGRPWSVWDDPVAPGDTPGETLQQVRARADAVVAEVLPLVDGGATIALVAHGHLLRVLATSWLEVDPHVGALLSLEAGTLSTLVFEHDRRVLGLWSGTPSLVT